MKNVTVAIEDELHRKARIRAAELGTSLSAMVKTYLESLADAPAGFGAPSGKSAGVREMPMAYHHAPPAAQAEGPPWLVDGKWVYTRDGKPRQPGAMRGQIQMADDFNEWPEDILKSFEEWEYGAKPDKDA